MAIKVLPEYVVKLIVQEERTFISGTENPEYNPMKPKLELYAIEKILDVFDEVQYKVRRILAKSTQLFILDVDKATGKVTWNGTRALYRELYG